MAEMQTRYAVPSETRSRQAKPTKVFGVGLHKSGTSSLRIALEELGYRVCGPNRQLLRAIRKGDYSSVDGIVSCFDAFEDLPWPLIFKYLFERYGNSAKFVLTTRISAERWFASIESHARTSGPLSDTWRLVYDTYRPFGRMEQYIRKYISHNTQVREFFSERGAGDRLLELCFERGDGWVKLCEFLGEPVPDIPFPHTNRAAERRKLFARGFNAAIEPIYRGYVALSERTRTGEASFR